MTKPYNKIEEQRKKARCIDDKDLKQLLLYRFINHYGYDKGEVTAKAIINDITQLIEDYFLVTTLPTDNRLFLNYGQLVWMAVPIGEIAQPVMSPQRVAGRRIRIFPEKGRKPKLSKKKDFAEVPAP